MTESTDKNETEDQMRARKLTENIYWSKHIDTMYLKLFQHESAFMSDDNWSGGQVKDALTINRMVKEIHESNIKAGWWTDPETGESLLSNPTYSHYVIGLKMGLIISEVIEALEGYRADKMDDKLPHRPMVEVELADAVIRIFDLVGVMGLDLGGAIVEKRAFNAIRKDHKVENRVKKNGKRF